MKCFIIFGAMMLIASPAVAQTYRFEAEDAQRFGNVGISTASPGYSGDGYVTNFFDNSDYIETNVTVPNGLYALWVGYRSASGEKGYKYRVGDEYGSGMFDQSNSFTTDRAGVFEFTGGGSKTLGIYKDWGYHDVDNLELRSFNQPAILPVSAHLSDPLANQNTQMLMNYMTGIYGQKTLAGHQHNGSANQSFPSSTYLNLSGGLKPAIRATDLIEYSPTRLANGSNPNNETEQSRDWAKQNNGIVSMSWHWNAPANLVNTPCGNNCGDNDYPWWKGFYTQGTTFNLPGALANPAGSDYQLLLRDIDAISVQLKKFQDANVPVIWRPLHEAQGGWFWWGAHGPTTFKQLWRLMHNRMTTPRPADNFPGLHNLIWEYTSSAAETNYLDWYPGDDVVDMVGLDIYTDASSSMSGQWYDMLNQFNGRKMLALSESGTLPSGSLMHSYGPKWSYFSLWGDDYLNDFSAAQVQALLNDSNVITLNELPTLPWSNSAPIAGDFNHNGKVDMADYVLWRKSQGQSGWGLAADSDLNGHIDAADYAAWRSHFGQPPGSGSFTDGTIPEPASWMLLLAAALPTLHLCRSRAA